MQQSPSTDRSATSAAVDGGYKEDAILESFSDVSNCSSSTSGSMDLRGTVPESEQEFKGESRSAEKVMDPTRRFREIAGFPGGTDDDEDIAPDFLERAKKSAILLRFKARNVQTREHVPYLGQAGILRNANNVDELTFVTRKHNLATDLNKQGVLEVCFAPHECILPHGPQYEINIPNTGWRKTPAHAVILRDDIPWGNGYDISLGPVLSGDGASRVFPGDHLKAQWLKEMATEEVEPFDVVSNSFLYERDLKIGMIVYNRGGVIANKDAFSTVEGGVDSIPISDPDSFATVTRGRDQTRVVKVFGEGVMIYTGRITRVCDQHIEYNSNTYEGCSGAVVILMERGHPDFGKALAIHAGYRLELGTNLGFKLAGIFDRPFVAAEW